MNGVTAFPLAALLCLVAALALGATCPGEPEAYAMFVLDGAAATLAGVGAGAPRGGLSSWRRADGVVAGLVVLALALGAHLAVFGIFCSR